MSEWKIGYKVFRYGNESLYREYPKEGLTVYHEWVNYPLPGFGPFTVFKTLVGAEFLSNKSFIPRNQKEIKKVWYKESASRCVYTPSCLRVDIVELELWNSGILLPGTTALADALMIAE